VVASGRVGGSAVPRLVLLGVLWGVTFPVSRLGVTAGANPFLLVAIDFGIAAALAGSYAAARRSVRPPPASLAASAGVGALLIAGINLPLFWGERFATGGAASVVYATSPLVSLGFAALLGARERVGLRTGTALALGLGGVLVLALSAGGTAITSPWGLAAFGLGATCQGAGAVVLVRLRPRGEGPWGATFQFVGGGVASLVVVAAIAPRLTFPGTAPVVGSVLYVGVVSMAAGYAIFFDLLRTHGAVGANQVTFLNPIVALAVGVLLFAEPFVAEELVGLALILAALGLLHLRPRERAPTPAAPSPAGRAAPEPPSRLAPS
jgi:drug/metabolite transporter (DMT)-like permease